MKRKCIRDKLLWLSSALMIFLVVQTADAVPLLVSATKTVTLGGLTFNDDDLVVYDTDTETSTLFFDGSAFWHHNEDIDAVTYIDEDSIVLSTKGSAHIHQPLPEGNLYFNDDDLVRIDLTSPTTGTASLYFDGSEHLNCNEDIDAVTVLSNGNILLSTKSTATIDDLTFKREDLVLFDVSTGTASMFFDGSEFFETGYGWSHDINPHDNHNNIDAVSVIDSDSIVISTAKKARIGDFIFNDEDLMRIDLSSPTEGIANMYFDGSEHFEDYYRADIDAVAIASAGGDPIPEPATIALLGIGLAGLAIAAVRRRFRRKENHKIRSILKK